MKWFVAICQAVVALGSVLTMLAGRKDRPLTRRRIAECLLSWSLPINVGVGGIFAFVGHTFRAEEVAEEIGWPANNPFQTEVAVSNLAFGVLGLLSIRFRGLFWFATAVGQAVFLLGAAGVHTREMLKEKNFNPGNAGPIFFFDILQRCALALIPS